MLVQCLDLKDPLEKEMATHSSILAWRIPWTRGAWGLQSIGLQKVEHRFQSRIILRVSFVFNMGFAKLLSWHSFNLSYKMEMKSI